MDPSSEQVADAETARLRCCASTEQSIVAARCQYSAKIELSSSPYEGFPRALCLCRRNLPRLATFDCSRQEPSREKAGLAP